MITYLVQVVLNLLRAAEELLLFLLLPVLQLGMGTAVRVERVVVTGQHVADNAGDNLSQSMQEEQSKKEINGQPNGSNPAMNLFMVIDG